MRYAYLNVDVLSVTFVLAWDSTPEFDIVGFSTIICYNYTAKRLACGILALRYEPPSTILHASIHFSYMLTICIHVIKKDETSHLYTIDKYSIY